MLRSCVVQGVSVDLCVLPTDYGRVVLPDQAAYSLTIENAGGSSNISEALSMKYMYMRHGITEFIPEMEVSYWIDCKKVDYLMFDKKIGEYVGVSVTRAVPYPRDTEYTLQRAETLLRKKLHGLVVARASVSDDCGFSTSILHVWCYNKSAAINIQKAHEVLLTSPDRSIFESVSVICTICGNDYIYTNRV